MRRVFLSAFLGLLSSAGVFVGVSALPAGAGCSSWSGAGLPSSSGGGDDSGGSSSSGSGSGGTTILDGGYDLFDAYVDCGTGPVDAGPLVCAVPLSGFALTEAFIDASWSALQPLGGTLRSGTYVEVNIDQYPNGRIGPSAKTQAVLVVDACAHRLEYNDGPTAANGTFGPLAGTYVLGDGGTSLSMTSDQTCCQQTMNCGSLNLGYTALDGVLLLFSDPAKMNNRVEAYAKIQ